jgi:hypothetical protein
MAILTDRLLTGIKRRVTIPASQVLLGDTDLLALGDDVMRGRMVSLMMSLNQNYFVTSTTQTVTDGEPSYSIPYRSIGRGLRDLKYSTDGTATSVRSLTMVALEEAQAYNIDSGNDPSGFYFKGDKIILLPTPTDETQYIEFFYDLQPNQLVELSATARVTAVASPTVTVSSVPSTITAGVSCDVIQSKSGGSTLAMDIVPTAVTSTTISFDADDFPDTVVVGDFVTLAQQSPVIQLPDECYPLFESAICERVLYAIGDYEGSAKLMTDMAQEDRNVKMMMEPRIEGALTKIVNRSGLLRGRGNVYWRTRGGFYG